MIYLDTHVIAWLYAGKIELIPEKIQEEISTGNFAGRIAEKRPQRYD